MLKVGDVMTIGALELRVRFQIRRPTIKPKTPVPVPGEAALTNGAAAKPSPTGTVLMPKFSTPPSKEVPKGAITYAKVVKQLRKTRGGESFLEKLGGIFSKKK